MLRSRSGKATLPEHLPGQVDPAPVRGEGDCARRVEPVERYGRRPLGHLDLGLETGLAQQLGEQVGAVAERALATPKRPSGTPSSSGRRIVVLDEGRQHGNPLTHEVDDLRRIAGGDHFGGALS
ncbi:MAG TPA: hypothetical protein VKF16_05395 [Candidatus Dormibacteraeota bacterium]|nr:hypothetical protein [Candidatus Dormibacteraeota bacterium]